MRIFTAIMLSLFILSCNGNSPASYINWIESESGFVRNIEAENFNISLQYCPVNYLKLTNKSDIASDSIYYFIMKVEPKDHLIANGFSFNQSYFAFDFPIHILVKEDMHSCEIIFWHMENTYNITSARNFLMAVKKTDNDHKNKLVFSIESEIINKDKIDFTFDLSREPKVQL